MHVCNSLNVCKSLYPFIFLYICMRSTVPFTYLAHRRWLTKLTYTSCPDKLYFIWNERARVRRLVPVLTLFTPSRSRAQPVYTPSRSRAQPVYAFSIPCSARVRRLVPVLSRCTPSRSRAQPVYAVSITCSACVRRLDPVLSLCTPSLPRAQPVYAVSFPCSACVRRLDPVLSLCTPSHSRAQLPDIKTVNYQQWAGIHRNIARVNKYSWNVNFFVFIYLKSYI